MYTCNGSPKGCERERFGHCLYCDSKIVLFPYQQRIIEKLRDAPVILSFPPDIGRTNYSLLHLDAKMWQQRSKACESR